jgi:BirA family transcriptional regulator, biotin operon repressor / biotin---[acetyl-CoA-carboxylase] ligase
VDIVSAAQRSGFTLEHHDSVGSTNDLAFGHLREGGASRHFVIASSQTGGRGRLGRQWVSRPGNLYASLALVDPAPQPLAFQLGFVAALTIHQTLLDLGLDRDRVSLKWPNDVLVDGRKISGILVEGTALADGHIGVVIGCGVNVAHHPTETLYPVTNLTEAGISTSVDEVFAAFAHAFDKTLALYSGGMGFDLIREAWLDAAHGLGGPIVVRDRKEEREGVFKGLDPEGRLLLEQSGAIVPVISGDVFYQSEGNA